MRAVAAAVGAVVVGLTVAVASPPPPAAADTAIGLSGHGWGHGRGMGQYGTYGYVHDFGLDPGAILQHYYRNTNHTVLGGTPLMTVRLTALDGRSLEVTSGADFSIGSIPVPGGWASRVTWNGSSWDVTTEPGCGAVVVGRATTSDPTFYSSVGDPGKNLSQMLSVCESGGPHAYRGALRAAWDGTQHAVNIVGLEDYVRAVVPRESPASWPTAALQVQAVAARSYAVAQNRYSYAKICDTTSCQVYGGAGKNGVSYEYANSDLATFWTIGVIRTFGNGAAAATEYSSSTGGYTVGPTFPAVPDAGDATSINSNHTWRATLSANAVAAHYGVGSFVDLVVTARNGLGDQGGRVISLDVVGTSRRVSVSGPGFAATWGLKSDWFWTGAGQPPPPPAQFLLRNANSTGYTDGIFTYGARGDTPLLCDWNGDGYATLGVFRDGLWLLRNSNSNGHPDAVFPYGSPGDIPVCGHWNGGNTDTVGVFRNGVFYLRLINWPGAADIVVPFGDAGDKPVVGDWGANGTTTVGVFRRGVWHVAFGNGGGIADAAFGFGNGTDTPIAGDWTAIGRSRPGVVRNGVWYMAGAWPPTGNADLYVFSYGDPFDLPLVGDFDGNKTETPGVARGFR